MPFTIMRTTIFILLTIIVNLPETAKAQTEYQPVWEKKLKTYEKKYAPVTFIQPFDDGQKISVIGPFGIETFETEKGELLVEMQCETSKNSSIGFGASGGAGVKIGAGPGKSGKNLLDELDGVQKVVHLTIPHYNAALRFDYSTLNESITLVDLESGNEIWTNNSLSWSIEKINALRSAINNFTPGATATPSLGMPVEEFPAHYVAGISYLFPEKDLLLIDSFTGLVCLDLKTGETNWNLDETSTGLSHIMYDDASNSLITFGGNPAWLPTLPGLDNAYQTNKSIYRLNADSGEIIWKSNYNKNYRVKKHGGFENEPVQPDIRLMGNHIITNFNQIEVFDFETGTPVMETSTGKDATAGLTGYGPASEFSLPVFHNDHVYRYTISNIKAFGASVGNKMPNNYDGVLEAYNIRSGEMIWSTDEYSRQKINNMSAYKDLFLAGFDSDTGIKAFDARSGEVKWQFQTGKRGVGTQWILTDKQLIFNDDKTIRVLNPEDGSEIHTIDPYSTTNKIDRIQLYNDQLLIIGKKGLALYNLQDGQLVSEVSTGFELNFIEYPDKVVLEPTNPSDPLMILNKDLSPLASIPKSGKRSAITWCQQTQNVYAIEGKDLKVSGLTN